MGQVSTLFAHKVVGVGTARGPRPQERRRELLWSVGVDPDAPVDPKQRISDHAYYGLCERIAREDEEGVSVPLRVGASMCCDDYGAFGLAWKSAIDLRGSFERAARYARVLTSVSAHEVQTDGQRTRLVLHRAGARRLGLRLSNEQTIAAIAQISREVCTRRFTPDAVYFKHPAPSDVSHHEAYFGCPVFFGADCDALQASDASLSVPNRLGDRMISEFFDTHLEQELAELVDDGGLAQQVHIQISHALSQGVPAVADVADRLGLSERTLQRRLADKGHAYQDLVDAARRELAERLLRRSDYALAEVAFLTGFSEQSAFTRAFKRWSGVTPARYRRGAASA